MPPIHSLYIYNLCVDKQGKGREKERNKRHSREMPLFLFSANIYTVLNTIHFKYY